MTSQRPDESSVLVPVAVPAGLAHRFLLGMSAVGALLSFVEGLRRVRPTTVRR